MVEWVLTVDEKICPFRHIHQHRLDLSSTSQLILSCFIPLPLVIRNGIPLVRVAVSTTTTTTTTVTIAFHHHHWHSLIYLLHLRCFPFPFTRFICLSCLLHPAASATSPPSPPPHHMSLSSSSPSVFITSFLCISLFTLLSFSPFFYNVSSHHPSHHSSSTFCHPRHLSLLIFRFPLLFLIQPSSHKVL